MRRLALIAASLAAALGGTGLWLATAGPARAASLSVEGEQFVLTRPGAPALGSRDMIGAVLAATTVDGQQVSLRIDAVMPSKEQPSVLLHSLSVQTLSGAWIPFCDKDGYGRSAGFPVAGAWKNGRFIADPHQWYMTCTSGSQGKCILFGYDPWKRGPHGESLVPYYEACQRMVRADYSGDGHTHTKNGTLIDIWDHIGIEKDDDPAMPFEAGWTPAGAACVAKTRWADLATLASLKRDAPRIAGHCDEATATARGAILFNRSR